MRLMMHTDKPLFKALNVTLLYAMLLNSFAPVAYAAATNSPFGGGHRGRILPGISNSVMAEQAVSATRQPEELNLETEKSKDLSTVHIPEANTLSVAATGGPGQGESSGFSLGSTDELVNKFTGDFNYNITLANIEGYPIVLNYNSNVGMNSEASWVGLGWDLNVGAVSREMRGLPDEFNGEQTINRTFNQESDMTSGFKMGPFAGGGVELFGFFTPSIQLTALWGKYENTYIGIGKTFDFSLGAAVSLSGESELFIAPSFGFGYSSDTKRGIGKGHAFGISAGMESETNNNFAVGLTFGKSSNSRMGLTERTVGFEISKEFKNKSFGAKYGSSASVTYGTATSIPSTRFNAYSETSSNGIELYVGQGTTWWNYRVGLKTQWNNTEVNRLTLGAGQVLKQPAIGYFHNGKRAAYEPAHSVYSTALPLMDFNRSSDYEFSETMVNLPFSIQTYDIFRASAMGLGSTFRARRHDVGTYYDPTTTSDNYVDGVNGKLGAMFPLPPAPPLIVKLEIGISNPSATGDVTSGNLGTNGGSTNALEFATEAKGTSFDSRIYFKEVGELTPEDMDDFNALGDTEPVRFQMNEVSNEEIQLSTTMTGQQGFSGTANSGSLNQKDDIQQAVWYEPFTAEQYSAEQTTIDFFLPNAFPGTAANKKSLARNGNTVDNNARSKNHLSAVEVTNTTGMRYVFSIPAYDLLTSQVSFCATGISPLTAGSGVCAYDAGDNTINNTRGVSHYYDKTDVPAYAHSFLLTEMLSADYIDIQNNGPSLDDVGSYFKFNYTRLYGDGEGQQRYKWKFPMGTSSGKGLAMMNSGLQGTSLDDAANYSYGEKEVWYVHSVESKNMVAEFHLTDRKDAYGVNGEAGALNSQLPLKKLERIEIYNLSERMGPNGDAAVPLQIIEFEYTYELCKNFPGNINGTGDESGKLTLTKIRAYTGASTEMGLYTYEFKYDAMNNPDYSYDNIDAWGNYKLSTAAKPNNLLPYPVQTEVEAHASAKAWKLSEIQTPAHGSLEVTYEADNYATVQDHRAMRHLDIKGMTNILDFNDVQAQSTWDGSTKVYKTFSKNMNGYMGSITSMQDYFEQFGGFDIRYLPNNVIVFKLDEVLSGGLTKAAAGEELKKKCFTDANNSVLKELYIKLHVKVKDAVEEFLPTFCRISNQWSTTPVIGVMPKLNAGADYEYGYIIIDPALVEEESDQPVVINSLQRSALEFIRRNLPDRLYGACPTCVPNNWLDKAVARKGEDVNRAMAERGWAAEILTDYTSVRLFTVADKKYGGGSRVKSLTYKDNWQAISGEYDGVYTWNYEYAMRSKTYGNSSYEPQAMIDECALYQWETYVNVAEKFPDETRFTPTPVANLLFPTPVVGYEKVKVGIAGTSNLGYSLSEFHTSFTHPVIERETALDHSAETHKPHNVLTGKTTDRYGLSQGFYIHTNDFHGKPLQTMIYDIDEDENAQPVLQSRSTYHYVGTEESVSMSNRVGLIKPERVSLEYDMHADSRYIENSCMYEEIGLSLKVRILAVIPFIIPIPVPTFYKTSRTQGFYAHAFVKHLNTSAVVKSIEIENFGSINSMDNLVYDRYSGGVILSSLKDEYDDPLYSLSYPSHWAYHELMDISSAKNNPVVTATLTADGGITTDVYNKLSPGDYVKITSIAGNPEVWIAKRNAWMSNQKMYLMKSDGTAYLPSAGTHTLQIIKTNRDNRLGESMQSIQSKKRPTYFQSTQEYIQLAPTEVISASVVSYRDRNNFKCDESGTGKYKNKEVQVNKTVNPYLYGVRGDLVMDAEYLWQSERVSATHPYRTRFDGAYSTYFNFYRLDGSSVWRQITQTQHPDYTAYNAGIPKWRKLGQTLVYDDFGKTIESKDEIQVRSAVLYGYDRALNLVPVAQASNARQQEIAFDGFEDYNYQQHFTGTYGTSSPHFDFKGVTGTAVDSLERHSGTYSLKVNPGVTASVVKASAAACDIVNVSDSLVNRFRVLNCNCIKDFEPTPGTYVISAWVRNTNPAAASNGEVIVAVTGLSPLTFYPDGPVLDGWQRVEGTFVVPSGSNINVTVSLKNTDNVVAANFDDLRIHPVLAAMETTVYDPKTLLPVATHDGYNFTTFYNYDDNLRQVRIRMETLEGIKTISETEMGGNKQPQ